MCVYIDSVPPRGSHTQGLDAGTGHVQTVSAGATTAEVTTDSQSALDLVTQQSDQVINIKSIRMNKHCNGGPSGGCVVETSPPSS